MIKFCADNGLALNFASAHTDNAEHALDEFSPRQMPAATVTFGPNSAIKAA